jgi:hypothetical protein
VHIPKEQRNKLDFKSYTGYMVGYASNSKVYRILLDNDKASTDVIFDEGPSILPPRPLRPRTTPFR